jgi:hypothetical protein
MVIESGWRDDQPDFFEEYVRGNLSARGAVDLLWYLDSRVEVLESMSYEERGGSAGYSELQVARRARRAVARALVAADLQYLPATTARSCQEWSA